MCASAHARHVHPFPPISEKHPHCATPQVTLKTNRQPKRRPGTPKPGNPKDREQERCRVATLDRTPESEALQQGLLPSRSCICHLPNLCLAFCIVATSRVFLLCWKIKCQADSKLCLETDIKGQGGGESLSFDQTLHTAVARDRAELAHWRLG